MPKDDPAARAKPSDRATGPAGDLFAAPPLPVAELDDAQRLACLRLIRSENVGPVTFRQLINHYGGAERALEALPGIARRGGRKTFHICPRDKAEAELEAAKKVGATPLFTIEPGFPRLIALLENPPPLLYVKGRVELLNAPALAIVGARQASAAGIKLARTFAHELGERGLVIVSGLARGIDGAAHQAALATGTVAVVAGGVDVVYPPEHAQLHESITREGCVISELPCGFQPRGKDFPRRNRLISGLCLGVLVVEAARRSGTLSTARLAGEQGREVFAVPGHPLDPRAEGTNYLLKNGAVLVTDAADVLDVLLPLAGPDLATFREPALQSSARFGPPPIEIPVPTPASGTHHSSSGDNIPVPPTTATAWADEEEALARVTQALGPAPIDVDEIVRATQLPAAQVRICLMELDLAGRIVRHGVNIVSSCP